MVNKNENSYRIEIYDRPKSKKILEPYKSIVERFYNSDRHDKDHRPKHIYRSLVYALWLIRDCQQNGIQVDVSEVLWSVCLHDIGTNHHDIPDHGDYGAKIIAPFVAFAFQSESAVNVINNVEWHNKDPNLVPKEVWTIEHQIMRTADALDLPRMHEPREIILSLEKARELLPIAEEFIKRTQIRSIEDDFEIVTRVAMDMGLLVA